MAENPNAMAGGGELGAVNPENGNPEMSGSNQLGQERTYTQAEVLAEADKRVNQALENQKKQFDSDFDKRLKAEIDKAEKRAKMTAEERAREQLKEEREQLDADISQHNADKLRYDCAKQLNDADIPVSFAELLTGADSEATAANIKLFKSELDKAVQAEVEKRLKGKAPATGGGMDTASDPFLMGFGK